jgi:hypothetical protein
MQDDALVSLRYEKILAPFPSAVNRLCGKKESGSADPTTSAACSGGGPQPDAAGECATYRTLCDHKGRERKYGLLSVPSRYYEDRFEDGAHGHRLQEDASGQIVPRNSEIYPSCVIFWNHERGVIIYLTQ